MQQRDMEQFLHNFSQQNGNSDASQAAERIRQALNTPSGREAVQRMMNSYGNSLEDAARMAQSGNLEGAKKSVQNLLRTPEGAQLAAQITKMMGR